MEGKKKFSKKRIVLAVIAGALVVAGALGIGLKVYQMETANAQMAAAKFVRQASNDSAKEIKITRDITLSEPLVIDADKVITGSGSIKASSEWKTENGDMDYLFVIKDGGSLTVKGSVKMDAQDHIGAIYVDQGTNLSLEEQAEISDGKENAIYDAGTFTQKGGIVKGSFNNVYVAEGGKFTFSEGENKGAGNCGIIVAEKAYLNTTSLKTLIQKARTDGIRVEGEAVIDHIRMVENRRNQIHVTKTGKLTLNKGNFEKAKLHGITNSGTMVMNNGVITESKASGIVNMGTLDIKGGRIFANEEKGVINRGGGTLTILNENVTITGNNIGVAVEENSKAEIAKAIINSNDVYNVSCFGELYIHDIETGDSGSNCIATNYGGHVVAENMVITSTRTNNGIYNINGSTVELKDVTIKETKSRAIQNKGGTVIGENVTIIGCGHGVGAGEDVFDNKNKVELNNLVITETKGINVTLDKGMKGTLKITNAELGFSQGNNIRTYSGKLILENVKINGTNGTGTPGTKEYKANTHCILSDETEIVAKNLQMTNNGGSALRLRAGTKFTGTNITAKNIKGNGLSAVEADVSIQKFTLTKTGESAIYLEKSGNITLTDVKVTGAAKNNVNVAKEFKGTATLKNAELGKTTTNNIRTYGGKLVLENAKIYGASGTVDEKTGKVSLNNHCILADNTEVVAKGLWMTNEGGSGLRLRAETKFTGTDVVAENVAYNGVSTQDATVDIKEFTVTKTGQSAIALGKSGNITLTNVKITEAGISNVNLAKEFTGTATLKNAELGKTTTNNIRTYGGKLVLEDVKIFGASGTVNKETGKVTLNNHCVLADNTEVVANGLWMTNEGGSGLRLRTGTKFTGTDVVAEDVAYNGVATQDATADIKGFTVTKSGQSAIALDKGGDVTLTDVKVTEAGINNVNLAEGYTGTATLKNAEFGKTTTNNIRTFGGKLVLENAKIYGASKTASLNNHCVLADNTEVVVKELWMTNEGGSGLRLRAGAKLTGTNVVAEDVAYNGVSTQDATANIKGFTVTKSGSDAIALEKGGDVTLTDVKLTEAGSSNINLFEGFTGTATLKNAELGKTTTNNVRTYGGKLVLENAKIYGASGTVDKNTGNVSFNNHGVLADNTEVVVKDLWMTNEGGSGLRLRAGTKLTGTNVVAEDVAYNGVSTQDATADIKGFTVTKTGQSAIALEKGGDVTLTDVKLTEAGINNVNLAEGFTGTATLKNAELGKTTTNNIRTYGGKLVLENAKIDGASGTNIHGILADNTEVQVKDLSITNEGGSGLRLRTGTKLIGTNVVVEQAALNGLSTANDATAEITGFTVKKANSDAISLSETSKVTLTNVEVQETTGYALKAVAGSKADIKERFLIGTAKQVAIEAEGSSNVSAENVTVENVSPDGDTYGVQCKGSATVTIDGYTLADGVASSSVSLESGYTGTTTVKKAVIGKTTKNNIKAAGGTLILDDVVIRGTTGDFSSTHGVLADNTEIQVKDLRITNEGGSGLRLRKGTQLTGSNVVVEKAAMNGLSTAYDATVEITGFIVKQAKEDAISLSETSKVTLTNVEVQETTGYALKTVSGTKADIKERFWIGTAKTAAIEAEDSSNVSAENVTVEKVSVGGDTFGVQCKGSATVSLDGYTLLDKAATSSVNLASGYTGTTTVKKAVLGETTKNNIRTYGGKLVLEDVDIYGTTGDNSSTHCILTDATIVDAKDVWMTNAKGASGLRLRNDSTFTGTDITIENVKTYGISTAITDTAKYKKVDTTITGLTIKDADDNAIVYDAKGTHNLEDVTITTASTKCGVSVNSTGAVVSMTDATITGGSKAISNKGNLTLVSGWYQNNIEQNGTLTMGTDAVVGYNANWDKTAGKVILMNETPVQFNGETKHTAAKPMTLSMTNPSEEAIVATFKDAATATALQNRFIMDEDNLALKANDVNLILDTSSNVVKVDNKYYTDLQSAIAAVNENASGKTTVVTFLKDVEIGSKMTINGNVTIQNKAGSDITIYRGTGLKDKNMFAVNAGGSLTIKKNETSGSLTIDGRTKAEADAGTGIDAVAGSSSSLINNKGTVNLNDITVQYVKCVNGNGAVIYNQGTSFTVSGCTFSYNSGKEGGVIWSDKYYTVDGCTFAQNSATHGGAIKSSTRATITDSIFQSNSTTGYGGAVHTTPTTEEGLSIVGCTFTENSANEGGAIGTNDKEIKITIDGCTFTENTANLGGAIRILGSTTATITDTLFKDNEASKAGAITVATGGIASFTDCEFSGNIGESEGNDIRLGAASSKITISGKFLGNVHSRNKSQVKIVGALSEGSAVEVDWYTDNFTVPFEGAILFVADAQGNLNTNAEEVKANKNYIQLGEDTFNQELELKYDGATGTLQAWDPKYVATVNVTLYESLTEAVKAANAIASEDTTIVTLLKNVEVESTMTISGNVTIQNKAGSNITIYRGSGLEKAHVFDVKAGGSLTIQGVETKDSLVIDGRTKVEAEANTGIDATPGSSKSMIYNVGTVTLNKVRMQYVKRTEYDGGVINNDHKNAVLSVTNSLFDNNYTTRYGSVVYNLGAMTFENTTFTNNKAGHNGGVLCHNGGTSFTVTGCTFTGNSGREGGAIWSNANYTVDGCTFSENHSINYGGTINGGYGGAILNRSTATIKNSTFQSNIADQEGGAISTIATTGLTIENCKFIENSAKNGGAVRTNGDTINITIDGCEFKENSATATAGLGGALVMGAGTTVTVTDTVFNGNTAPKAGAVTVANGGNVTFTDCEFKDNKNTGSTYEGDDVRLDGTTSIIKISGKFVGNVYRLNPASVQIAGALSAGSAVEVDWFKDDITPPFEAIKFVDADGNANANATEVEANKNYIQLGERTYNQGYELAYEGTTGKVVVDTSVAIVNGTPYESFVDAVNYANANTSEGTTIVTLLKNVVVESKMTISGNVTIQNKAGRDITLYRGTGLTAANMFGVNAGGSLTIKENETFGSLIIDGRTKQEAEANTGRDAVAGSSSSLINNKGTLNLNDITVQYVKCVNGNGAVIYNQGTSFGTSGCTFSYNSGKEGGVIWSNQYFTVDGCTFNENSSTAYGGAILNRSNAEIKNSTFQSNETVNNGGAIHTNETTDLTIKDCTFTGNSGKEGGAISTTGNTKGITIEDCEFKENSATNLGGAILLNSAITATITDTLFEDNEAFKAGAISVANSGKVSFADCEFTNNENTGTDSDYEGDDIRLGGANSEIKISGKFIGNVHQRNKSKVQIVGALSAGSAVEVDWYKTNVGNSLAEAILFVVDAQGNPNTNVTEVEANKTYISLGAYTSGMKLIDSTTANALDLVTE